ncbi:Skg3 protein [Maudiozyma humilis]|uniref:Skg3 protein n=1 Tax=Maudiozyma humilis TaxID=51915 RepID=A0AAV5RZ60_MAUHU|nr:Skg3 protein [Kazachstania humilis]
MKRFISGSSSLFRRESSSSAPSTPTTPKQRSASSFAKRFVSEDSTPNIPDIIPSEDSELAPELVPIVTLITAHTHRRYHKGMILVLNDLKNDGTPTNAGWEEMYSVLVGTQLALWDAKELAECSEDPEDHSGKLKRLASRPNYLNLTDASIKVVGFGDNFGTEGGNKLENTLVISTTLKNRYFLKFSDADTFNAWHGALRLSQYESVALQLAYTGAFLSSRGSKLGDIQVILADSKFTHTEWVSVRFGTGMPWKRCFAVISQTGEKKKSNVGKITFYESDKKIKKANAMATISDATEIYSVYPSSPKLIDTSTIIKLEGTISLHDESTGERTNIFIMPEKHQGVPGYDTIIRFMIPAMNAFRLYGRPKRLIASRDDTESLVYALPTLPNVYYLKCSDVLAIIRSVDVAAVASWTNHDWRHEINDILLEKIRDGYTGITSGRRDNSVLNSPVITPEELFTGTNTMDNVMFSKNVSHDMNRTMSDFTKNPKEQDADVYIERKQTELSGNSDADSVKHDETFAEPVDEPVQVDHLNLSVGDERYDPVRKSEAGLGAIYDKYAVLPSSRTSKEVSPSTNILETAGIQKVESPYEKYMGNNSESRMFEISNIRDSSSSANSNGEDGNRDSSEDFHDVRESQETGNSDLKKLSERIGAVDLDSFKSDGTKMRTDDEDLADVTADLNFDTSYEMSMRSKTKTENETDGNSNDVDVFDPEYEEEQEMYSTGNPYVSSTGKSLNSSSSAVDHTADSQQSQNSSSNSRMESSAFPHSSGSTNLNMYANNSSGNVSQPIQIDNPYAKSGAPQNVPGNNVRQIPNQQAANIYRPVNNNVYPQGNKPYPNSPNGPNPFGHPQGIRTGPLQPQHPPNGVQNSSPLSPNFGNPYQQNQGQRMQYPQQMNRRIQHPHQGAMPMNNHMPQQGMPQYAMPQQGMPRQGMPRQGMPQQGMPPRMNGPNPMYKNPQYSNSGNSVHSNGKPQGNKAAGGFSQFMPSSTQKNPYAK